MNAKRPEPPAPDDPAGDERRAANELSDMVDEASLESFPASDPPAWTGGREQRALPKAKTKTAASFDAAVQVQSSKCD